jgi:hypothetical protein
MSRLRPPPSDSYGLTSRDDTRLLDHTTFSTFWKFVKVNVDTPLSAQMTLILQVDEFLSEGQNDDIDAITHTLDHLTLAPERNRNDPNAPKPVHLLSDLRSSPLQAF